MLAKLPAGVSVPAVPACLGPSERFYVFDDGILSIGIPRARTTKRPHAATITIAVNDSRFELSTGASGDSYQAAVIKPFVKHSLHWGQGAAVSILVAPNHPAFRAFRFIAHPGIESLDREMFREFHPSFSAVHRAGLPYKQARALFEGVISRVVQRFPPPPPLDPRVKRVLAVLQSDLDRSLEELAETVSLSYYRMSHLFSEGLGLPLRGYLAWQKIHAAFKLLAVGRKQSEILRLAGFADLSHFSHVYSRSFGVPPSALRGEGVEFVVASPNDETEIEPDLEAAGMGGRDRLETPALRG